MSAEAETAQWPELPFDEEFLRIVLLQARIMGKDITVEPYKSYNNELCWRRTDKYSMRIGKKPLTIEQASDAQIAILCLSYAFATHKINMAELIARTHE